jgi:hypothetical protein
VRVTVPVSESPSSVHRVRIRVCGQSKIEKNPEAGAIKTVETVSLTVD